MFIGYAFKFFDKAAGFSVDVGWVINGATPVSWLYVIQIGDQSQKLNSPWRISLVSALLSVF